jgi:hypothetical protein
MKEDIHVVGIISEKNFKGVISEAELRTILNDCL